MARLTTPRRAVLAACAIFACCSTFLAPSLTAQDRALSFPDLLEEVYDLDALWRPPAPGESCIQFSSYDRKSHDGPDDPEAWYANRDRGNYLRVEERAGAKEHVMVDVEGPGTVVRIWSANPQGRLFFYFDGAAEPGWTVDFAALLKGEVGPISEPLAGMRARGGNCHLPIPFARHLKISSDQGDFYYQVNVRHLPRGTRVDSFRPELLRKDAAAIARVRQRLAAAAAPTLPGGDGDYTRVSGTVPVPRVPDARGSALSRIPLPAGPGVVRELRMRLRPSQSGDGAALLQDLLRAAVVRIDVDGERTVLVPFADFFGSAPAFAPYGGLGVGVADDGYGYCRFPMPFQKRIDVMLIGTGLPCDAMLEWDCAVEQQPVPDGALRFRASWHLARDIRTVPRSDHLLLDAQGAGRFVGCMLSIRNPSKIWWGEGDEKFFVDGEDFPSTFGTGTEDYFGYAWGCPDLFSSPLHAQPQCDGPQNFGYTCVVRQQIPDQVPFHRSFRFELEVWHWRDVLVDYATTAWWYGAPGARDGLPELPPSDARLPRPLEPPKPFFEPGVIEAETLKVIELGGGERRVQELGDETAGPWSGGKQLWWIDAEPGEKLALSLPVPAAGRYRLLAAFTKAADYGIVQVKVNGQPVGEPQDLYHDGVIHTGPVALGPLELSAAGPARVELVVVGRNEEAIPRHMVGIDWFKLEPR